MVGGRDKIYAIAREYWRSLEETKEIALNSYTRMPTGEMKDFRNWLVPAVSNLVDSHQKANTNECIILPNTKEDHLE